MVPAEEAVKIVAQFKSIVRTQSTFYFTGSFPASV
jgi:hypothetical protein